MEEKGASSDTIIVKIKRIIVNHARIIVKLGNIIANGRKRGLAKFHISQNQEDNSQSIKDNSQNRQDNSQWKKKASANSIKSKIRKRIADR